MPTKGFTTSGTRRISFYDPLLSTTYSTSSLWQDCPLQEHQHDPSIGFLCEDNMQSYYAAATTGDWVLTQATSGSAAMSTTIPGTLSIDSGATTDNQGAQIQRVKAMFIPATGKDIWAEFYVSLTATTPPVTKAQLFVGLAAIDTTIIAAGAMTTSNRIGWEILDGGLLVTTFTCDKAGVEVTKTGPTLVAATKIRLGFRYDGTADTVQQYVNGATSGTTVATASVPKLAMYPSFVCQSDGTDQPILNVHGYRIFQLR
jgi:hypothetical protein